LATIDVDAVADALTDACFTVVPATTPVAIVGDIPVEQSHAVEARRGGETALVSVVRFAEPGAAVDAGAVLGSDAMRRVAYFAAGPALVVIEADDPELAEDAYAVLTRAAHDLR
jgi:hypothetical protein